MIVRRSIRIAAPIEDVYELVTQPDMLLRIWPSLVEVKNVARAPDGSHSFDWTYKMVGAKFRGHTRTVEVEPYRHHVTKSAKGIASTLRWTYEPISPEETVVTLEADYEIPNKLGQVLAVEFIARANEHEADTLLANLKKCLEVRPRTVEEREARLVH